MDKTDLRTRRICVVNEKEQTWEEPTLFYYKDEVDPLISQMEQTLDATNKKLAQCENRYNLLSDSKSKDDIKALIRKRSLWVARRNLCRYFSLTHYFATHKRSRWSGNATAFNAKMVRAEGLCFERAEYLESVINALTGKKV